MNKPTTTQKRLMKPASPAKPGAVAVVMCMCVAMRTLAMTSMTMATCAMPREGVGGSDRPGGPPGS